MSQNRRNYGRTAYDKNRHRSGGRNYGEYVDGNTVRKLEPARPREKAPVRKPHHEVRKNRDKARYMNAGYVLFLAVALCASAFILVNFIQLQSELTNLTKAVAAQESELNYLKLSNDEEYNRIISSIDLEEIKRVAMGELGMVYASEEQVVKYEGESGDYMRQVTDDN